MPDPTTNPGLTPAVRGALAAVRRRIRAYVWIEGRFLEAETPTRYRVVEFTQGLLAVRSKTHGATPGMLGWIVDAWGGTRDMFLVLIGKNVAPVAPAAKTAYPVHK